MGQIEWTKKQMEFDMSMILNHQPLMKNQSADRQQRFADKNQEIERIHRQLNDLQNHPAFISMRSIFRPTNK